MDVIVAVDASTTACKAVAFGPEGQVVALGRSEMDLQHPQPAWHEQDANDWWAATSEALRLVTAQLEQSGHTPVGLGLTHQRESVVCLDADFAPLRPAILWIDSRCGDEVRELGTETVHDISGKPPSTTPSFYKLAWLKKHEPDILDKARYITDVHGFLSQRLTDNFATSFASADPMGLVDMRSGDWSEELIELCGIRPEQLPLIARPGDIIGSVTSTAAAQTGLPEGVPVVAGGGDGQCAGLGVGASLPGAVYLSLGTSITLGRHRTSAPSSSSYRILGSVTGSGIICEAFIATGALCAAWFREAFSLRNVGKDELEECLTSDTPGNHALYFLPYLSGCATPYWDETARGSFIGINDSHTWKDFYRAVIEGLSFEIAMLLRKLQGTEEPATHIVATGGGTASVAWLQIIADATGMPIRVSSTSEATALGAAMIAAAAVGFVSEDLASVVQAMTKTTCEVTPHSPSENICSHRQRTYESIYPTLRPLFRTLAD